jgi:AcrR family transcriptional regulator
MYNDHYKSGDTCRQSIYIAHYNSLTEKENPMARPRVFDVDAALEIAMELFWRKGYENTSLADLTDAIGITPPSLYHEFGSKEGLFRRALERYIVTRLRWAEDALECPTAREVAEQMLTRLAVLYTDPARPPGCLAVNCSSPGGAPGGAMELELVAMREARRERIRRRFEEAQRAGELPASVDTDELARYLMTVGWGLACGARLGESRANLLNVVKLALNCWPG